LRDGPPNRREKSANRGFRKRKWWSALDGRTTRREDCEVSQGKRKLVEEPFGWGKTIAVLTNHELRAVVGANVLRWSVRDEEIG